MFPKCSDQENWGLSLVIGGENVLEEMVLILRIVEGSRWPLGEANSTPMELGANSSPLKGSHGRYPPAGMHWGKGDCE